MEVTNVTLKGGFPDKVSIEIDAYAFALLAYFVGKQTWDDMSKIHANLPAAVSEFYNMASGDLFNRYYEGGISDAVRRI